MIAYVRLRFDRATAYKPVSTGPRSPAMASDRGAVAGLDGVMFGVLIFVIAMLAVVNVWAIVEARNVANSAAREYLRAWTEAPDLGTAEAEADNAARSSFAASEWRLSELMIDPPSPHSFGPCGVAEVTVSITVPAIELPIVGGIGTHVVRARRTEVVDPYRAMQPSASFNDRNTPCRG